MLRVAVAVGFVAFLYFLWRQKGDNIDQGKEEDGYDFIVVGSGPSGAVVASRLSEDPKTRVLLLEAGISDAEVPDIKIPGMATSLVQSKIDWDFVTEPQERSMLQQPGQRVRYPRGKVLGGTSTINYNVYTRGSPHDYDYWEDLGAEGWSYKDVEPYFKRVERATMPDMSKNLGNEGFLKLSRNFRKPSRVAQLFIDAADEVGLKFVAYHENIEGLSHVTQTIYKGIRQYSANTYLQNAASERKDRLHVIVGAHVTKILTEVSEETNARNAIGVRYKKNGNFHVAKARRETIISCGAIGTPHLLLLSGIGPKEQLEKFEIEVIADLPGVGANLQNHIVYEMGFTTSWKREVRPQDEYLEQYNSNGTGPLGELPYMMIHAKSSLSGTTRSLSSRKRPFPELQYFIGDFEDIPTLPHVYLSVNHNHLKSSGFVKLLSTNPEEQPLIDPKHYQNEDDFAVHIDGFRLVEQLEESKAFKAVNAKMIPTKFCNGTKHRNAPRDVSYYKCALMEGTTGAAHHQCCTAKMGSTNDEFAVVDSQLRLHGVGRLRIADASVMPHITSSNIQAPCYMIGEKAADMIKKSWRMS